MRKTSTLPYKAPHRFAGLTIMDWAITTGAIVIGAALILSGCADTFTRGGVTNQQADADLYQCQRENSRFSNGGVLGPQGDIAQQEMVRQCMRARGYQVRP